MSVSANLQSIMNITQILDQGDIADFASQSSRTVNYNLKNQSVSLSSSTSPAIDTVVFNVLEGTDINKNVSMLTLDDFNNDPVNKKLVSLFVKNSTPAHAQSVAAPLFLRGSILDGVDFERNTYSDNTWGIELYPGQWSMFFFGNYGPNVSATAHNLYAYGYGGTDAAYDFLMLFG